MTDFKNGDIAELKRFREREPLVQTLLGTVLTDDPLPIDTIADSRIDAQRVRNFKIKP